MTQDNSAYAAYQLWLQDPLMDEEMKLELQSISEDRHEIEDRFYKELEFGTGGLRGVIGAGMNRMNRYTIGKATQGLAQYLIQSANSETPLSVAIAYDSRNQSPEFALEAALVLAGNGIRAHVFRSLRSTPELSYAVRDLNASAGIVITASHNPPEYNGYKVYGSDGGQLVTEAANQVTEMIRQITSLSQLKRMTQNEAEASNQLCWINEEMDRRYIEQVTKVSLNASSKGNLTFPEYHQDVKIVFTPLHGTGNKPIREALQQIGCTQVFVVKEQELPDANFSTVQSPNPEEAEAFTLAIQLAEEIDADIVMGTDPDCDRMGAVVRNAEGQFIVLTGNQIGALLTRYLISRLKEMNTLPSNGVVIKTIVTSELGAEIAKSYGISVINTLTGFKYIGEKITEYEKTGEYQFLFGYEESYGYLAGTHCRDKDAVVASMLICEAAAFYKNQGKTLNDVLQEIYQTYGYYLESLETRTLKGKAGVEKIQQIMQTFRINPPKDILGIQVIENKDYSHGIEGLPQENVLKYVLEDGSWFCLRPSGTEPKIKIYFSVITPSASESHNKMKQLIAGVMAKLDNY